MGATAPPPKFGEGQIRANSSGRIGKNKFLSAIKTEKFSKIGNDEQEFGYWRAFGLPYTYHVQYVILIPSFFLTKHSSRAIRADRLCSPQIIRARTPMFMTIFLIEPGRTSS